MCNENGKIKPVVILLIVFIVIVGCIVGVLIKNKSTNLSEETNQEEFAEENTEGSKTEEDESKDEIKIFNGDDRPIAVMIDNNVNAQPQSALNRAFLVYEIIVEGGETRLMAVFKGIDEDVVVGPVRSARHYFVDYSIESDAIYAHLGQSPRAEEYIVNLGLPDINGQAYDTGKARTSTSLFWRSSSKSAPHNAYTSLGSLKKICEKKGISLTSTKKSTLNYVAKEVDLSEREDSQTAETITIPYATAHTVKYIYDSETKRYTRYSKGKKQTDGETGEDVTTKNLVLLFVKNTTLNDGENKGRQDLDLLTTVNGYYITNGKAIKITGTKEYIGDQTLLKDLDGNEIEVNDGNTWINVCPIDSNVVLE